MAEPVKVYATVRQLHGGRFYEVGDEIQHFAEHVLKAVVDRGDGSKTKPKPE